MPDYPPGTFAEEIRGSQYGHDGFLAMAHNHGELDLAFLVIEERVGGIALGKYRQVLAVGGNGLPLPTLARKDLVSKAGRFVFMTLARVTKILAHPSSVQDGSRLERRGLG